VRATALENRKSLKTLCPGQLAYQSFPWVNKLLFGEICESNLIPVDSFSLKVFSWKGKERKRGKLALRGGIQDVQKRSRILYLSPRRRP
jgi:hypothetical protein